MVMGFLRANGGIRLYDQNGNVAASIKPASLGNTLIQAIGRAVAGTLTNTGFPLRCGITPSPQTNLTVWPGGYSGDSGDTCAQSASHRRTYWSSAVEDRSMCAGSCNNTVTILH